MPRFTKQCSLCSPINLRYSHFRIVIVFLKPADGQLERHWPPVNRMSLVEADNARGYFNFDTGVKISINGDVLSAMQ